MMVVMRFSSECMNVKLEKTMLFIEKDDPSEAPESGDKKPKPDQK